MHAKAILKSLSWRQLFYHGEAVGLVAAWAIGLIIALGAQSASEGVDQPRSGEGLAVVSQSSSSPSGGTTIK